MRTLGWGRFKLITNGVNLLCSTILLSVGYSLTDLDELTSFVSPRHAVRRETQFPRGERGEHQQTRQYQADCVLHIPGTGKGTTKISADISPSRFSIFQP